jgi:hypothetical protein
VFAPEASTFNVCDDAPEIDREINREVRTLTQALSAEERQREGEVLARNVAKITAIDEVSRTIAACTKDTLKGLKNRVDAGSSVVNRGERQAPVAVAHVLSVDARTVQFVRLDTGEIIDSRDATAAEKQLELAMVRR